VYLSECDREAQRTGKAMTRKWVEKCRKKKKYVRSVLWVLLSWISAVLVLRAVYIIGAFELLVK
jgi:hypothetical protein